MPYFLSPQNLRTNQEVEIIGDEAGHILLSHRVRTGEKIKLQGPNKKRFLAEVEQAGKKSLTVKVLQSLEVPKEPEVSITLFQSVVSEKALDFILQKGTELGLNKIVLFNSANTATKISPEQFRRKQERWNKILIEAAKQSERTVWPELSDFLTGLEKVKGLSGDFDKIFLTDIAGQKIIHDPSWSVIKSCAILIGPEGGFTEAELKELKTLPNVSAISLGPILLRAETAALSALSILRSLLS